MRKPENRAKTAHRAAGEAYISAMQARSVAGQGQAEPCSGGVLVARLVEPRKGTERFLI